LSCYNRDLVIIIQFNTQTNSHHWKIPLEQKVRKGDSTTLFALTVFWCSCTVNFTKGCLPVLPYLSCHHSEGEALCNVSSYVTRFRYNSGALLYRGFTYISMHRSCPTSGDVLIADGVNIIPICGLLAITLLVDQFFISITYLCRVYLKSSMNKRLRQGEGRKQINRDKAYKYQTYKRDLVSHIPSQQIVF